MKKEMKNQVVESIAERVKESEHFYILDSSSMKVAEINEFRRQVRKTDSRYTVFRNTLINRGLENTLGEDHPFQDILKGTSGILFSNSPVSMVAKLIQDFQDQHPKKRPILKAGYLHSESAFLGNDQLPMLLTMKSRQELISDVLLALKAPISKIGRILSGQGNIIAGLLKGIEEK